MKTLQYFNQFVKEINESNSRLYKQSVLKKYKGSEIIQQYLQIAFDPYKVYGISTKKLSKIVGGYGDCWVNSVFDLFEYLEEHNTGADKDISICQEVLNNVSTYDREAGELLRALICKDLSIGCDAKTINKEIPGLIPTFSVQLANKYFDKPDYLEGFEFTLTTKIDGGRIIAIRENDQVSFYTRTGQRYEGLVDLEKELKESFVGDYVFDGEITILNNKGVPSKDAYKQAMKITRSDGEKHGLKMILFDCMPLRDWKAQKTYFDYITRREMLESAFSKKPHTYFEVLPVLYSGKDTSKVLEYLNEAIANNEEGIMINLNHAPYEFKRTNSLLKVKKFNTCDLRVIGFEEGTGKCAGMLGAFICEYKGGEVKVGSGLSDSQRLEVWRNPGDYENLIIEVSYFEETKDSTGKPSLRFPTFKDFRFDKTEPNY
jgi:DNA ligase-1